ncbi:hypothetical protein [Erythrobacter donghaensis]|uniref:hypothetical protein n=1 Tax=Erythrobacter donghaensis TaxID=267135 RepID=UPI0012D968F3|nr:hypothetical protein [Erythrobacter donghaensis]
MHGRTNISRQTRTALVALLKRSAKPAKLKKSVLAITGALVLGGCSGIRPEAKAAWFLSAHPRPVEQYCVSPSPVSLSASDCNVLQRFAEAQVRALEGGKMFCLSVSDLRRNRQIWSQLSDKGKKALKEHSWLSFGGQFSGGSSASGGAGAWSPEDCHFGR